MVTMVTGRKIIRDAHDLNFYIILLKSWCTLIKFCIVWIFCKYCNLFALFFVHTRKTCFCWRVGDFAGFWKILGS
jgi:hypothetical protein